MNVRQGASEGADGTLADARTEPCAAAMSRTELPPVCVLVKTHAENGARIVRVLVTRPRAR